MARSRNIKPGFFQNDELAEIEPLGRLLFAGLWTIADREGRLKDRPKRIKIEILPFDDCDVNNLLEQLADRGFIIRYEVEGKKYIFIPTFKEHQKPHFKETASKIPAPTLPLTSTYLGSGGQQPKTEQAPTLPLTSSADSLNPHTDSLQSDSLNPESGNENGNPSLALVESELEKKFEEFWDSYPRRVYKTKALKQWRARMKEHIDPNDLINAARNYADERQGKDVQYTMHPATFIGSSKCYKDFIKPPNQENPHNKGEPKTPPEKYENFYL